MSRNVKKPQDPEPLPKLSEAQQQAVALVAIGKTGVEIAGEVGVSAETVSRWRQTPQFQAAVNRILTDVRSATRERLRRLAVKAVDTIESALDDPATPVRYRLDIAFKLLQLVQPRPDFDLIGPIEADEIAHQNEIEKRQKLLRETVEKDWLDRNG